MYQICQLFFGVKKHLDPVTQVINNFFQAEQIPKR